MINDAEGNTVRSIFRTYLELKSVRLLQEQLEQQGIKSKRRDNCTGRAAGGSSFSRGALYHLLSNPIYLGRIRHRDKLYPGQHQAIIDEETFEQVQKLLAEQRVDRKSRPNGANCSALAGKVFDETRDRLVPSHSKKGKVRYRYYVSQRLIAAKHGRGHGWRLPAKELEEAAFDVVRLDPAFAKMRQRASQATELNRSEVLSSVQKATVSAGHLSVCFDPRGVLPPGSGFEAAEPMTAEAAFGQRRRGIEVRMVVESERPRAPDLTLVRMVHRATSWVEKLREGAAVSSLAAAENVQVPFISRRIHLGLLSPKIVTAIIEGRLPAHLTTQALIDMDLSMDWREQEAKLLGVV